MFEQKEYNRNARIQAETDDPQCSVASYKQYISKLNPGSDAFFQRPKTECSPHDGVWYVNAPVGKNNLNKMMTEISTKAKLS